MNLEDENYYVALAMRTYGGSFFRCIGEALSHADLSNIQKVKSTWPSEWASYLQQGLEIHHLTEGLK